MRLTVFNTDNSSFFLSFTINLLPMSATALYSRSKCSVCLRDNCPTKWPGRGYVRRSCEGRYTLRAPFHSAMNTDRQANTDRLNTAPWVSV